MKYYLKDKNGIVHTESNEHKFKLALEYKFRKDDNENTITYGPGGGILGMKYPFNNEEGSIFLGVWNIGLPKIHKLHEDTATTSYWAKVSNSHILKTNDILIGKNSLISNRDISNDIIIKYNTNFDKIPTGGELDRNSEYGVQNNILTLQNLYTAPPVSQNTYNLIKYTDGELITGPACCWQVSNKISHTTTNLTNKYYRENTISFDGGAGQHPTDYFTIDVSNDWKNYSKIRIRIKMMVNIQISDENLDFNSIFGDIKNHTNSGFNTPKPFIIIARTTNNSTLTEENDTDTTYGGIMFYNGSTKGDTITSFEENDYKNNRSNRTYDYSTQNLVDIINYVPYSENVYYSYIYSPKVGDEYYTITKEEIENYLQTSNPRFSIICESDYNKDDFVITHGKDIKELDDVYKNFTHDQNWYKTALNFSNPFVNENDECHLTETLRFSCCNNVYIEGYLDINVSELKKYLHICFPYLFYTYNKMELIKTTTISDLEMSVEGVN